VTVVATPLTCDLPTLPLPLTDPVGYPSPDGQSIYLSTTDAARIMDYLIGLQDWIDSAAPCIEAR
jgi:hypothetical protein